MESFEKKRIAGYEKKFFAGMAPAGHKMIKKFNINSLSLDNAPIVEAKFARKFARKAHLNFFIWRKYGGI